MRRCARLRCHRSAEAESLECAETLPLGGTPSLLDYCKRGGGLTKRCASASGLVRHEAVLVAPRHQRQESAVASWSCPNLQSGRIDLRMIIVSTAAWELSLPDILLVPAPRFFRCRNWPELPNSHIVRHIIDFILPDPLALKCRFPSIVFTFPLYFRRLLDCRPWRQLQFGWNRSWYSGVTYRRWPVAIRDPATHRDQHNHNGNRFQLPIELVQRRTFEYLPH